MGYEAETTTNATPESCLATSVGVRVCFDVLWNAHPLNNFAEPDPQLRAHPCRSLKDRFSYEADDWEYKDVPWPEVMHNQCAAKMSVSLQAAGVKMSPSLCKGVRFCNAVFYEGKTHTHPYHAISASELGLWLVRILGKPQKYLGKEAQAAVTGRKGIVFFEDFWARNSQEATTGHLTGDHLDLWNGEYMTGRDGEGRGSSEIGDQNNFFDRSKSVWFWECK